MKISKTMGKVLGVSLACTMALAAGCSANNGSGSAKSGGTVTVNFWSAPEKTNYDFWSNYAKKFNATKTQVDGQTVNMVVQQMPAQPSSEAGIQNAIVTGSIPAVSENINRSFAATLAASSAVYDLSNESWYKEIVSNRKLTDTMPKWKVNGAEYVIPLYVNPISLCYNSKALADMGVTKVPETLDEFKQLLSTYSAKKSDLSGKGISNFMYRYELTRSDSYWERWFDFDAFYYAFSQGKSTVDGDKLVMDKSVAKQVFDLYGSMGNSLLVGQIDNIWSKATVPVVVGIGEPWDIVTNKAAGKTYGLSGDYVYGQIPVLKSGDTPYTFADSKGLVFYKNAKISTAQHDGAVAFVKYCLLGGGKSTFDSDWISTTSMLPARGDLETDQTLADFFSKNPEWKDVSGFVKYAVPCMDNQKMSDILTALGAKGLAPYVNDKVEKVGINQTPDSTSYVNAAYDAMKTAGNLQ